MLGEVRQREIEALARDIEHRIQWERISQVERLEAALHRAQQRLGQALGLATAAR
jgi:hypothetical protein